MSSRLTRAANAFHRARVAYESMPTTATLEEHQRLKTALVQADAKWRAELAKAAGKPFRWVTSGGVS